MKIGSDLSNYDGVLTSRGHMVKIILTYKTVFPILPFTDRNYHKDEINGYDR